MKNAGKKLLSAILVVAMLVSLAPAVYATEADTGEEALTQIETTVQETAGQEEVTTEPGENGTDAEPAEGGEDTDAEPAEGGEDTDAEPAEGGEGTDAEPAEGGEDTDAEPAEGDGAEETEDPAEENDGEITAEDSADGEALEAAYTGPNMEAAGLKVISQTKTNVANGVSYDKIVTKNTSNLQNVGYLTSVDLSKNVKILASYNGYYTKDSTAASRAEAAGKLGWSFSMPTKLAKQYESILDPQGTVVMATNGDYFNMGTGEPLGYLIMEGNAIKTTGEPYFAILKDGTAVIRDAGTDHSDVLEAISGPFYLIKDGKSVAPADDSLMPRNSVGVRADGSVVFYENDGRQAPYSAGMGLNELASVLLDAGCVTALYLDGGGSASVSARPEGSDTLKLVSSPSDGQEREVSSAILIISTEESTGVFDHAAISPKDELYTPGTQIQFTASGVDSAGAPAELPADVSWVLTEESKALGAIDASGLFTAAADQTGVVTVELHQGDKVVGTASVEIVKPDAIYFNSDEVSLGFNDTTDLGLVVRNEDRDINIKAGDIIWAISDEKMGSFDGNLFTSSDGESLNGDITATSAFDESVTAKIHVIVGMLPTLVWDFEDHVNEDGSVTPAEDYYGSLLTHSNYGRGGQESFEIVSIDDGEPVRFGEKSLKLNYDFTQCGAVTEGACIGSTESMAIPGVPTGIGVWVYAPEGVGITWEGDGTQAGFWLRGYVVDATGIAQAYDFTLEPKAIPEPKDGSIQPGIYWEGWKYLEADLTRLPPPYSIQKGMTFRLMYVAGTMMGTKTANSIYFDNLQFVYGTNVDDVDNPRVDSIAIGTTELENGAVLNTNTFTIRTTFSDAPGKYATGVDGSTVRMYVDGVNVVGNERYNFAVSTDGYAELYDLKLADGTHSISVSLRDNAGNDVQEIRYFTVSTGTAAPVAVTAAATGDAALLGSTVDIEIRATDSSVTQNETVIRLGNMFTDYEVQFSENYTGESKYTKSSYTLTVNAQRKEGAAAEDGNLIATVKVKVPTTLTENESFIYEIKSGSFTTADYYGTYAAPEARLPVTAGIVVSCAPILVGGEKGVVKVTDRDGKGVAGAEIYLASDNSLIGTTDENGLWETDYFSAAAGKVTIYAMSAGMPSFQYNVFTFEPVQAEEGVAPAVLFNATANSATGKSLTWLSDPLVETAPSLRYRVKDSEAEWTVVEAQSELHTFVTGGNKAANINTVKLSGLTAGTTYEYQISDGEAWCEAATFTVNPGSKFFIMADIQADDFTNVYAMMDNISAGGYNFGIQTGDAIDDVTRYDEVSKVAGLFSTEHLGNIDMIHALGNHEYYGDANADTASSLYALPVEKSGSYYSVTYGDVYVAAINYTATDAELITALNWLIEDAQASTATWKVLTMHQPPYYTNGSGGNAPINTYVPSAAEQAGINVVFSGHDHSLARTNRLTGGQIDEENGILYYIGGSSGEKSYGITSQSIFDYDTIFALATTDFSATYIGVSADNEKMVINMYDVASDGSQTCVDSYTLYSKVGACAAAGHVLDDALYSDGKLTCTNCGTAVDPVAAKFTGWAVDKASGLPMFFVAGEFQTGEFLLEETTYYFDENGVALDGPVTVDGVEMEFDKGLLIGGYTGFVKKPDGNTYHYIDGKMTYGWFEFEGDWYHFDAKTGVMCTQKHVMPDDESISKKAYYDFGEDGKLLYGYFNPSGYYYWAGLPKRDSWVKTGDDPDSWYRTNSSGHFVKDTTGNPTVVIEINGVQYTFDNTNGKLLKGSIVNREGVLYYYWAGRAVNNGWFEFDGDIYYAFSDGSLATGETEINGVKYTFSSIGKLQSDELILSIGLSKDLSLMTITLVNADEDMTDVSFTLTNDAKPINDKLAAKRVDNSPWTVTVPLCQYDLCTSSLFHVKVNGVEDGKDVLVTEGEVNVIAAPTHVYTDEHDATCNNCGRVRKTDLSTTKTTPMYRLYNPFTGEHFYTGSTGERDNLSAIGWNYEGVAWSAPVSGGIPVHRVCNPNSGDHHYTTDMSEVLMLLDAGWQYENICWNSAFSDAVAQYRMWNKNADLGSHHYTSSTEERQILVDAGWIFEGIGWYGLSK